MNILWKLLDAIEAQQQASAAREREEREECEKTPIATTVPTTPSEDNFNDDVALLRRLFGDGGEASSKPQEETETACKREVLEDDDSYLVVIDAVGAVKEQIEITYMDRILHVEFERRRPEETKGMEVVTSTICRSGRVVQALRLNSAAPFVSPDSITASLKSGWLSIRVPKADAHLYSAPLKVSVV
jgi:HSP20 family molecular chaperone IbpA